MKNHLQNFLVLLVCQLVLTGLGNSIPAQVSPSPLQISNLIQHGHLCSEFAHSLQFIGEDKLAILVSSHPDCSDYREELTLLIVDLHGKLVAKRNGPWTSAGLMLSGDRLIMSELDQLLVFDARLNLIQKLDVPADSFLRNRPGILSQDSHKILRLQSAQADYLFSGNPLRLIDKTEKSPPVSLLASPILLNNGDTLRIEGKLVFAVSQSGAMHLAASTDWVKPCERLCQLDDPPTTYALADGPHPRLLMTYHGSRFPLTDAAGVFPYFRLAVYDIKSSKEVFRKQYVTHTASRVTDINLSGRLVAVGDPSSITFDWIP